MTVGQYFKLFPLAQKVLVVGEDLFHDNYAQSAQRFADQKGLSLEVVTRPETSDGEPNAVAKASKTK